MHELSLNIDVLTLISIISDAIAIHFTRAQDTVLESEGTIGVCLQVNPGDFVIERSVTFGAFSVNNPETTGEDVQPCTIKTPLS